MFCVQISRIFNIPDIKTIQNLNEKYFEYFGRIFSDTPLHGRIVEYDDLANPISIKKGVYSCDETTAVDVSYEESNCFLCSNRELSVVFGERSDNASEALVNDWENKDKVYCVLKKCPATHPLSDSDGSCSSCDEGRLYHGDNYQKFCR